MFWRKGLARPHSPFPVFPECQLHCSQQSKLRYVKQLENCKISGYLGDYRSTSRQTHPTHRNKTNDPLLNLTPENIIQKKCRKEGRTWERKNNGHEMQNLQPAARICVQCDMFLPCISTCTVPRGATIK